MMTIPTTHPLLRALPHGLEDFARDVAARTSLESLRDLLATLPAHLLPLAGCATSQPNSHTRRVLLESPECVIELRGYLPGQRTMPHDHGPARCAFRVLAGIAIESRHERDAKCRVMEAACDRFLTGSVLACEPGLIHSIINEAFSSELLVTLHAFRPAPRMATYDLAPHDTKETRE